MKPPRRRLQASYDRYPTKSAPIAGTIFAQRSRAAVGENLEILQFYAAL
jgi:hypothetical protein